MFPKISPLKPAEFWNFRAVQGAEYTKRAAAANTTTARLNNLLHLKREAVGTLLLSRVTFVRSDLDFIKAAIIAVTAVVRAVRN